MRNFSILFGLLLLNIIRVECIIRQNVLEIDDYEDNNGNSNDPFKPPKYRYTDPIMGSKVARMLVSNNRHGMINTKYEINNETITMSLPEYSIDCFNNGDPILLFIKMSHNFKNIEKFNGYDNSITYTVNDESKPEDWPGATKGSMYGLPRVNLRGYFRELIVKEDEEQEHDSRLEARYISKEELYIIEECFIANHQESSAWFPGENRVHSSVWTEFVVEGGYFVGGFGGYAYIGELDSGEYHASR